MIAVSKKAKLQPLLPMQTRAFPRPPARLRPARQLFGWLTDAGALHAAWLRTWPPPTAPTRPASVGSRARTCKIASMIG